jgi:outer membrane protein assembly factor BamB
MYSLVASTGQIAWSKQTGGYVYAGPAAVHQTILFGSYDHRFYALNARTGAQRWRFDAKARISGSATIVEDIVYFSTFGNGSFGLNVNSGALRWRRMEGRYSPVVATRDAFYFTGYNTLRRLRPRNHPAGLFLRADGSVVARGGHAAGRR